MDNFEVRQGEVEKLLKSLGRRLKKAMPKGWGFTLLIFSYGDKGATFYTSSAEREGSIKLMKEFLRKMESN